MKYPTIILLLVFMIGMSSFVSADIVFNHANHSLVQGDSNAHWGGFQINITKDNVMIKNITVKASVTAASILIWNATNVTLIGNYSIIDNIAVVNQRFGNGAKLNIVASSGKTAFTRAYDDGASAAPNNVFNYPYDEEKLTPNNKHITYIQAGYILNTVNTSVGTWNGGTSEAYNILNITTDNSTDLTPPTLSNFWCSSCIPADNVTPYGDGTSYLKDATPTFNLSTNENANCYINFSNSTLYPFTTTGGGSHIATQPNDIPFGYSNICVYCNDTFNNGNQSCYNFSLIPTETYSYESEKLESETSVFTLNITNTNTSLTTATFYYNGTAYTPTKTTSGNISLFNYTLTTPRLGTLNLTKLTWYWFYNATYLWNKNYYTNTSFINQTIYRVYLDNCSILSARTINFTLKDITTSNLVDGNIEVVFDLSYPYTQNYSFAQYAQTNHSFCLFPSFVQLTNSRITAVYSATNYENQYYNNLNITLSNVTQEVILYLINGTSLVTFTVTDENDNVVPELLIYVMLYDVGTNSYLTQQILKTDSAGQAFGQIKLNSEFYKFMLVYNGQIVYDSLPTILTSTTKNFRISLTTNPYFDKFLISNGIASTLTYSNDTNNFAYTFNDLSGTISQGCLKVVKRSASSETLINETCVSSTAATILVNIGASPTDTYTAIGYVHFSDVFITNTLIERFTEIIKNFGNDGIFISFFLIAGLVAIGMFSPILSVVFAILGLVFSAIFGLWNIGVTAIVTIVLLGMIAVWKLSSKGGQ